MATEPLDKFSAFLIWVAEKQFGVTNHDRVAPGALNMAPAPTTVVQYINRYQTINEYVGGAINNPMYLHFFLLVVCSIADPSKEYCYDNVIADLTLNSGNPEGIFAILDLFTWSGWIEAYAFLVIRQIALAVIAQYFVSMVFGVWYAFSDNIKLCEPGDVDPIFGFDLCNNDIAQFVRSP
uniref:Uncharacterized protein n=1 Tax=Strombidium rassoulzadegani TaxID=1082188 RepID=A0A7S3CPQ5_9SPIT